MFFTVMDTPGMTAPVASVTVPSKVPRNVCALRIDADTAVRRNESTTSREIVRMTLFLFKRVFTWPPTEQVLYTMSITSGVNYVWL
jgi:hypothetical protein